MIHDPRFDILFESVRLGPVTAPNRFYQVSRCTGMGYTHPETWPPCVKWKPAHEPVWNEPWKPHATMVGDQPFLCIFCWTREVNEPARVIPSGDWVALEKTR